MPEAEKTESSNSGQNLEREMGAPMLAIYGAGTILGAGIYVLIGKIIGEAGLWAPLAFFVAATVAGINGLVYAELATRSPRAGGPTEYVAEAFHSKWFAIIIGWMIVATGVVSAGTIASGFASYLTHFVDMPGWIPKTGLVLLVGTVAAVGVKESSWFMAITTTLGVAGLLFVMYVGFFDSGQNGKSLSGYWNNLPSLTDMAMITGVMSGAFLAVYSFIGFEDIVHMAEETRKPSRSLPVAIVVALCAAAILYVLVSLAVLLVMDPKEISDASAPLVAVVKAGGYPGWPVALLSLWIILNGALAQIIMASRVIYGLHDRGGSPKFLSALNSRTNTPLVATILCAAVILALTLFIPLKSLASATSLIMLLVFSASNGALIILERRNPEAPFDVPRFLPWVGLIVSVLLAAGKLIFGGGGH